MDRISSPFATREAPNYSIISKGTLIASLSASVFFVITVLAMLILADTSVAAVMYSLYELSPIVGVIVVGIGLTVGRYLGFKGFESDDILYSATGVLLTIITYAVLGGAILTPYESNIYLISMVIATMISLLITVIAGVWVITTDRSFEDWNTKSAIIFVIAFVFILLGSIVPESVSLYPLLIGFGLTFLGFLVDLVYEIWELTSGNRSPLTNGFGIYIAFTGVFIHILQMVLESVADT